ncbi:MAG TPA: hypothetical protein ENK05_04365 [Gammaproteobacteria bacterium]|nr:hypothetical protein [Gammaproteobacteria bacterium]
MTDDARCRVQYVLLDDLLDIQCRAEGVDEVWNNVSLADLDRLNQAGLLTTGVGGDHIYLNECVVEGKRLPGFPTRCNYDYADYLFQAEARKRGFPEHGGIAYYGWWFRFDLTVTGSARPDR